MKRLRLRPALFGLGLALAIAFSGAKAPAALEMVLGDPVVGNVSVTDCETKAQAALNSVLSNAFSDDRKQQWLAYGQLDGSQHAAEAAAIHCYPLTDSSYVATFTCSAQVPPSTDTATTLCGKLEAAFGGKSAALSAKAGAKDGGSW